MPFSLNGLRNSWAKPDTLAEHYFSLPKSGQREALETASGKTGLPAYLLEKDVWVVWTLSALFQSKSAPHLTFKGGTSLSKAYKIIQRFSENINLTCDIRELIKEAKDGVIPSSRSQADKWTEKVRKNLPGWIKENINPVLQKALSKEGVDARLENNGKESEKLIIHYPPLIKGNSYVSPTIQLEFGARSTGEPHEVIPVSCDMADSLPEVLFPTATLNVMLAERAFWEKATAAHVYCHQDGAPSDRFSRHWYDLVEISKTDHFAKALADKELALNVARHKEMFFREKDAKGNLISYREAVGGKINLVPTGKALEDLESDYGKMTDAGLIEKPPSFKEIMTRCGQIESQIHKTA